MQPTAGDRPNARQKTAEALAAKPLPDGLTCPEHRYTQVHFNEPVEGTVRQYLDEVKSRGIRPPRG